MDFSEYVVARGPALERFAYVLTGDAHRAQDLVQTALLKAYRRWRWVARADHPDAYVRRIVTTSYVDWRRRRSNAEEPVDALPDRPAAGGPGGPPDPADRVADRDELQRALATLSPRQRAVLVLRHYEGWDDASIAAALRCGEPAVRTHASRGLQRLRDTLGQASRPAGGEDDALRHHPRLRAGQPTAQGQGRRPHPPTAERAGLEPTTLPEGPR